VDAVLPHQQGRMLKEAVGWRRDGTGRGGRGFGTGGAKEAHSWMEPWLVVPGEAGLLSLGAGHQPPQPIKIVLRGLDECLVVGLPV